MVRYFAGNISEKSIEVKIPTILHQPPEREWTQSQGSLSPIASLARINKKKQSIE